jgi:hypothetical protein
MESRHRPIEGNRHDHEVDGRAEPLVATSRADQANAAR